MDWRPANLVEDSAQIEALIDEFAEGHLEKLKTIHTEEVAVDTGTVLLVDPTHLFTQEEWSEIVGGPSTGDEFHARVVEAVKAKFIAHSPLAADKLSQAVATGGDGLFEVEIASSGDVTLKNGWKTEAKEEVSHAFKVTADPETMEVFKAFMAMLELNGEWGHSGTFGMSFDGDGSSHFAVDGAHYPKALRDGVSAATDEPYKGNDGCEMANGVATFARTGKLREGLNEEAIDFKKINLKAKYDHFNRKYFGGTLPKNMKLVFSGRMKNTTGEAFCNVKWKGKAPTKAMATLIRSSFEAYNWKITMATRLAYEADLFDGFFLHEMIHVWVILDGWPYDSHGPKFREKAKEIEHLSGVKIPITHTVAKDVKSNAKPREIGLAIVEPGDRDKNYGTGVVVSVYAAFGVKHMDAWIKKLTHYFNGTVTFYRVKTNAHTFTTIKRAPKKSGVGMFTFKNSQFAANLDLTGAQLVVKLMPKLRMPKPAFAEASELIERPVSEEEAWQCGAVAASAPKCKRCGKGHYRLGSAEKCKKINEGSWGFGAFENDAALDWMFKIEDEIRAGLNSDGPRVVMGAAGLALKIKNHVQPEILGLAIERMKWLQAASEPFVSGWIYPAKRSAAIEKLRKGLELAYRERTNNGYVGKIAALKKESTSLQASSLRES